MTDLVTCFSILKLHENNYDIWAMLVETASQSILGHHFLMKDCPIPDIPNAKADAEVLANYKTFYVVLTLLITSISEPCMYIICTNSRKPFDVWRTLREYFMPSTNQNVIQL